MPAPTPPTYTDYTNVVNLEHPDCFVALYYKTSSWQVSNSHSWRITTYDKTTFLEINTSIINYVTTNGANARWCSPNADGSFVSDIDDVLWVSHPHRGVDSYDVTGGGISVISNIPDVGATSGWVNGATETSSSIWVADYTEGVRVFTKTGTGTANSTPAYTYLSGDNKFGTVHYSPDEDVILVKMNTGYVYHLINPTTFLPIDTLSLNIIWNGVDYTDDSHSGVNNFIKYDRGGLTDVKQYFNSLGWYAYENIDPDNINSYDELVINTGNVLGWWKCDEAAPNTTLLDSSANKKDMTISGTYTKPSGLLDSDSGRAYSGDGTGGMVARTNMGVPTNAEWALEFWIKVDSLPSDRYLVGYSDYVSTSGVAGGFSMDSSGECVFYIYSGTTSQQTDGIYLDDSLRHHVVCQYTTNQLEFWVDGFLVGTNSDTSLIASGFDSLFLSRPMAGRTSAIDGQVDNVILYDIKLTKAEIEARYALGATYVQPDYEKLILSDLPRAYFPLKDFNSQSHFLDISGNGYHATSTHTTQQVAGGADGGLCAETAGLNGQYIQTSSGVISANAGHTESTVEFWMLRSPNESGGSYDLFHRLIYLPSQATYSWDYAYQYNIASQYIAGVQGTPIYIRDDTRGREWVHVVITCSYANSKTEIWLNGVKQATSLSSVTLVNQELTGVLSNGAPQYTYSTKGKWQHWAIYSYILSDSQIISHYKELRPSITQDSDPYAQAVLDTNPTFYWKLDETSGVDYADTTTNMSLRPTGDTIANRTSSGINASNPTQNCVEFNGSTRLHSDHVGNNAEFQSMYIDYMMEINQTNTNQRNIGPIQTGGYSLEVNGNGIKNNLYHSDAGGYLTIQSSGAYYTDEVIHHGLMFDGNRLDLTINGYSVGFSAQGTYGYIDYTEGVKFTVGAEVGSGGTYTNYSESKVAHVVQYTNPSVPPTEVDYRKRFLLAMGYDPDNYTPYQQHVIDDTPLLYFPLGEWSNAKRTCAALYYDVTKVGNTCEPDARLRLPVSDYTRGVSGLTNDGSTCTEYTEQTGVLSSILQRKSADFAYAVNNWSFEGWFNLSSVGTSGRTVLVCYGGAGGDATADDNILYKLDVLADGSFAYIHEYATGTNVVHSSPAGLFEFNKTQYVVMTRNATSKELNLYINGIVRWTVQYSNNPTDGVDGRLKFGAPESSDQRGFIGKLQHLAIHETTLSQSRIRERYTLGSGVDRYDVSDSYAIDVLADTPSAYYRCNDQTLSTYLADSTNLSNDAYAIQGAVGFQQASGLVNAGTNKAIVIDGLTEIYSPLDIPDSSSEITIEFWYKLDNLTDKLIINRGRDGQGAGWSLSISVQDDKFGFACVTTSQSTYTDQIVHNVNSELGVWHYAAFVWDVGTGITFYKNGLPIYYEAFPRYGLRGSTFNWSIGAGLLGDTTPTGSMDEIAIYESLLPPQTIIDRYVDGRGIRDTLEHEILKDAPDVWWNPDKIDGSTVYDALGNFDGTFSSNAYKASYATSKSFDYSVGFPLHTDFSKVDFGQVDFLGSTQSGEIWFQFDLSTYTTDERILFQDGGETLGYSVAFYNGEFGIWVRDSGTLYKATIPHYEVPMKQRNQVGWVIDTNALRLYLNGKEVSNTTGITIAGFNGTDGAALGAYEDSGGARTASGTIDTSSASFEGFIGNTALHSGTISAQRFEERWNAGKLGSNYFTDIIELNPVLWYRFDDAPVSSTIRDSVNDAEATVDGANTMPSHLSSGGYNLGGFGFNGTNQAWQVTNAAADFLTTTRGYSINVWIKVDAYPTSPNIISIIGKTKDINDKEFFITVESGGQVSYSYEVGGSPDTITTTEVIPLDTWTMVTVTVDIAGNGYLNIYLNNVLTSVSNTQRANIPTATTEPLCIGNMGGSFYNSNFFDGVIDEVMYFNYELSPANIATIYNATADEYQITGTVSQDSVPVQRIVRVYRRDNGELIRELVSEADGTFDVRWKELEDSAEYFVIAFDDNQLPDLEAIARDRLVPNIV